MPLPAMVTILGPDGLPYERSASPCKHLVTTAAPGTCCGGGCTGCCGTVNGCNHNDGGNFCDAPFTFECDGDCVFLPIPPADLECCCGTRATWSAWAYRFTPDTSANPGVLNVEELWSLQYSSGWAGFPPSTSLPLRYTRNIYRNGNLESSTTQTIPTYGCCGPWTLPEPPFIGQGHSSFGFSHRDCRSHTQNLKIVYGGGYPNAVARGESFIDSPLGACGSCHGGGCPHDPRPGACCLPGGLCRQIPAVDCFENGGRFYGENTTCAGRVCPPLGDIGRCCLIDGSCQVTNQPRCAGLNGQYGGDGSNCSSRCPAPSWACCLPIGICNPLTRPECQRRDGLWIPGRVCNQVTCQQPPIHGACCLTDGSCQNLDAQTCSNLAGVYRGDGTDCNSTVCAGAHPCCHAAAGPIPCVCTMESQAGCAALTGCFGGPGDWHPEVNSCGQVSCVNPARRGGGIRVATGSETIRFGSGGSSAAGCTDCRNGGTGGLSI